MRARSAGSADEGTRVASGRANRLGVCSLAARDAMVVARFGIDAGHVRTAMSRLVTDGWLERERIGRNSYYRLSRREEVSFLAATRRIYFGAEQPFDGRL